MSPDPPNFSRSRAILIGTSTYQDKGFLPLPAAANSLRGLQEILSDPQLCRWPAERITVVSDPTDVRRLITNLRRWARETEDVLLVYFVGHGTIAPRGELCLALSDTEFEEPDVTGVEYDRIRSALLDSPARIKVVILDCCYSGRAIQALSHPENLADITDVRGVYTVTASDLASHVPPLDEQAKACTSFTGELLDLIRTGIPGGPDALTLNMIYSHLRMRLHRRALPAPNQRGTDTAGEFEFTRNAALLPHRLERFPRPETPAPSWRSRHRRILTAVGAVVLVAALVVGAVRLGGSGNRAARGATGAPIVVGSANFSESTLIGEIYAEALKAKGLRVTTQFNSGPREVYYPAVRTGLITVMPEYNGQLLTTSLNSASRVTDTAGIDAAIQRDLPASLEILTPAAAQDSDSVTVTHATAKHYNLTSIGNLKPVANKLVIGGPSEFESRTQGSMGLLKVYGLKFKTFQPLDDGGPISMAALQRGRVQAADIFTTDPLIKTNDLVVLKDPNHLFTNENVVPLVYKPAMTPLTTRTLNAVSAKLTQDALKSLDYKVVVEQLDPDTVAKDWLHDTHLS